MLGSVEEETLAYHIIGTEQIDQYGVIQKHSSKVILFSVWVFLSIGPRESFSMAVA